MGFVNLGAQLSGFVAPALIGIIVDVTGNFNYAFWMLIGFAIVCLVTISTIRIKKDPEQQSLPKAL